MTEETKKKEEVLVSKEYIEGLKETLEKQGEKIDLLTAIADRKRLAVYRARHREKLTPEVSVRAMEIYNKETNESQIKVIMAWKSLSNNVYQDPVTKRWLEDQRIKLFYQDGSSAEIPILNFYRNYKAIPCIQTGKIEEKGQTSLKLRRKDNDEELIIGTSFIN